MSQWIVIDKKTNICVGNHDHPEPPPNVDLTRFDLEQHPDGTIAGEPAEKFRRDLAGRIILRSLAEIENRFPEEVAKRILSEFDQRINALPNQTEVLKTVLKDILRLVIG